MSTKPSPDPATEPPTRRRRLQMSDIARLAGVSVATVSRALNGSALISAETRSRVQSLAGSMNYAINVGAKNLRLQRNRTIAVVIPYDRQSRQHVSDPFFLTMLGSLADAVTDRGFDLLLSRVDADTLGAVAQLVDSGRAVGVILIGQWRHHEQLNRLADERMPIVVWGAQIASQRYCTVGGDNVSGGALATAHLLSIGRRRIAFIGDTELPEVADRYRGHLQAHAAIGLAADPALRIAVPFDAAAAHDAITRLCRQGPAFDAVFACSDVLATASMQTLDALGRVVPRDVCVVGYDDIEWASHTHPPLTTVRQPMLQAGADLVDALLRLIGGETVAPRLVQVELVVRGSTRVGAEVGSAEG